MKQFQDITGYNSQVYYIHFDMNLHLLVNCYEIPIMVHFSLYGITASRDADTFGECR
jgi:hypothetical protein